MHTTPPADAHLRNIRAEAEAGLLGHVHLLVEILFQQARGEPRHDLVAFGIDRPAEQKQRSWDVISRFHGQGGVSMKSYQIEDEVMGRTGMREVP